MEFDIYCMPDKHITVVTKREKGETCEKVRQFSSDRILEDTKTGGPDKDDVHETT